MLRPLIILVFLLSGCSTHLKPQREIAVKFVSELGFSVESVEYAIRETGPLGADLYLPKIDSKLPAVVLIHGGAWSGGERSMMDSIAERLAKSGFVVLNISYRLAPESIFPAQIEDCKEAVRWLRANASKYNIDPKKIASFGYSAGGHLASLLGVLPVGTEDDSWRVQAVVAGGSPNNFLMYPYSEAIIRLLGTTVDKDPAIFLAASPVHHVTSEDPPFFMYHGTWDQMVDLRHTVEMQQALDRAGVENEVYTISGLGHIPTFLFDSGAVDGAIEFLSYHFKYRNN